MSKAFQNILLAFALTTFLLNQAAADVVRYVDGDGRTHFVSNEQAVPEEYRSQLENQAPLPNISKVETGEKQLYDNVKHQAPASKPEVEIYVADWCPYCRTLESFLDQEKIKYIRHDIETSEKGRNGYNTLGGGGIPITVIGDTVIRGFKPNAVKQALHAPN